MTKSPFEIVLGGEMPFAPELAVVLERLAEGEQAELVLERPVGSSGLKAAIAVWELVERWIVDVRRRHRRLFRRFEPLCSIRAVSG